MYRDRIGMELSYPAACCHAFAGYHPMPSLQRVSKEGARVRCAALVILEVRGSPAGDRSGHLLPDAVEICQPGRERAAPMRSQHGLVWTPRVSDVKGAAS